jgi:uncharacterized membrane protein YcaP (DUF421 family)
MFDLSVPLWQTALRTAVIYLVVLVGLRLSGKRQLGQMNVFDLVVILLVANAAQNAMVGADNSLPGATVSIAVILLMNFGVSELRLRWRSLRGVVEGTPTLLVSHGRELSQALEREGLDEETLYAALREHGIQDVSQVEMAVLEIDGSISIVPTNDSVKHVPRKVKFVKHG